MATTQARPQVELEIKKDKKSPATKMVSDLDVVVDVKGWKAMGNRLTNQQVLSVVLLPEQTAPEIEKDQQDDGQMSLW